MSFRRLSSSHQFFKLSLVSVLLLAAGLFMARLNSAQEVQPQILNSTSGVLAAARPLPVPLVLHTATLLSNGRLLVAGGTSDGSDSGASNQAFLYDPRTGDWVETGVMRASRKGHFAVLLQNGRVLVGGGKNGSGFLNTSEIYDPATQTWALTGAMIQPRHRASATLLANATNASGNSRNGFVLAVGGESQSPAVLDTAEYFNPATGQWKATANKLSRARVAHTATLLTGGDVMIAGGYSTPSQPVTDVDVYDPLADKWKTTNSMKTARFGHTATMLTNRKVLVAGGVGANGAALSSAEIFDAPSQTWTLEPNAMPQARAFHSASLLPNGSLFVVGGFASLSGAANNVGIVYSPDSRLWASAGTFGEARGAHTATILANARVLIAGGASDGSLTSALSTVEFFDPAVGKWLTQGSTLNQLRYDHTATLLANGKVLFAGGRDSNGSMKSVELYDPATDTWTQTSDMNVPRADHTATLLRNGKVLVAGGINSGTILDSAEVYDPVTGSWAATANAMGNRRADHTSTLLADGRVLIAGGWQNVGGVNILRGCELYNPATNQWVSTGTLTSQRRFHSATLLFDGRVLVAGGEPTASLRTSELYNPTTGQWSAVASQMHIGHVRHTATLLANGRVLVVSGLQGTNTPTNYSGSANLFDPGNQTWNSVTAPAGRDFHTATALPNGKVAIIGGYVVQNSGPLAGTVNNVDAVELYDPARGTSVPFSETTKITFPRDGHTATLLPNGRVLVAGGRAQVTASNGQSLTTMVDKVELFDVGLDAAPPVIPGLIQTIWNGSGNPVCATGVRFQGGGEASGANITGSSTNYPVIQLMRLDNEQIYFLSPDPNSSQCGFRGWTNNSYASLAVPATTLPGTNNNLNPGIALMTVFVNGIPNGRADILAPEAPADDNEPRVNLTGRIFTVADTGLQANIELRSSTGEVRNIFSGPNGEYIFEGVPTRTPRTSASNVTPSQIIEDSQATQITVIGSGFTAASQIVFNGVALTTTFINSTELRATIPATALQNDGFASVVVRTPSGNATLTTPPLLVRITAPNPNTRPTISSLSPASTAVNSNPGTIAINGVNLLSGNTQVFWNGQTRPIITAQSTATRLVFTPNASDFEQAGTATVQVQNAGGSSNSAPFTIMAAPPPNITGLNPSTAIVGNGPAEIAINGTNLLNTNPNGTTQVLWNGQSRTFVANRSSATQIIFLPLRTDFLQAGIATVRIFHRTVTSNGDTQVLSNVANFTINQQPLPSISSLSPASLTLPITASSVTDQTLTVNGTNFVSNSVVRVNGRSLTTSFVNSTRLTATIPGALLATVNTASTTQSGLAVTVLNPSTNLTSNSALFAVSQAAPVTLGSVLAYPYYTSSASNPNAQNTTFTITNTNTQQSVIVNLLFIEGATGTGNYYFRTLNANQTVTFRASDFDRGATGYLLAVASNYNGYSYCPIPFNFLRGTATVTTTSGYGGTVNAIPIRGFTAPTCSGQSFTSQLNFNGTQYDRFPSQLTADSIYSASSSASTLLVTSAIGGTLFGESRASSLGALSGTVVDSSLITYNYSDQRSSSQLVAELGSQYPLTNPRLNQILSPGEAGKLTMLAAPAIVGMTLTRTPSQSSASLMRTVALKTATLTIPVYDFSQVALTGGGGATRRIADGTSARQKPPAASWRATPIADGTSAIQPPASTLQPVTPIADGTPAIQPLASTLQQQQPPGTLITYVITPSGTIPTGEPIEFFPPSRVYPAGSGEISFSIKDAASGIQAEGDNNFCGRTSPGLKLGGTVTLPGGYVGESIAVNLKLTDAKAPDCNLPTDIALSSSAMTSNYLGQNTGTKILGLEGSYLITPADARFDFNFLPLNGPELDAGMYQHPPLNGASLGNNFKAYVVNICPASITATANGEAAAQVCQGQPINLETPAVPNATSYTWTLPDGSVLNGRTPVIPSATPANTGMYKVQVATPACVTPVETTIMVIVNPLPTAAAGADQVKCKSDTNTTSFTINGAVAPGTPFTWTVIATTGDAAATIADRVSLSTSVNVTGSGTVTIRLLDTSPVGCGIGGEAFDDLVLTVTTAQAISVTPETIPAGSTGAAYTQTFTQNGGNGAITWSLTGALPNGLSFNPATATLSGTPLQAGSFPITVTAADAVSCPASRNYTLVINQQNTGLEADVAPRPNGNGSVSLTDWVQTGRFASAADTAAEGSEFQRADCAPRATSGNGLLSISDWVQAGRYAAGLDPVIPAAGPTAPASPFSFADVDFATSLLKRLNWPDARTLRLRTDGAGALMLVEVDALGEENALGFSLNFDTARWRFVSAMLASEIGSATLAVNQTQLNEGKLGIALALPAGEKLYAGKHQLVALRFSPLAESGATAFSFGDEPISRELVDAHAESLPMNFAWEEERPLTVVSAANFKVRKLARESIAVAFGTGLAAANGNADGKLLPLHLAGTQVFLTDRRGAEHPAPLFSVSPEQVTFQIPAEAALGAARVLVRNQAGELFATAVEIVEIAPAIFMGQSQWPAATLLRIHADGRLNYDPISRLRFGENDQLILVLFGTGLRRHQGRVTAQLGSIELPVLYAGAQGEFAGLDQLNLALPESLSGTNELILRLRFADQSAPAIQLPLR